MKLQVKITKEVLRISKDCSKNIEILEHNCAIAIATKCIFGNCSINYGRVNFPNGRVIVLPQDARDFITRFDNSTPEERIAMPELTFEIDVPDSLIEEIGIEEAHKIIAESKTLALF